MRAPVHVSARGGFTPLAREWAQAAGAIFQTSVPRSPQTADMSQEPASYSRKYSARYVYYLNEYNMRLRKSAGAPPADGAGACVFHPGANQPCTPCAWPPQAPWNACQCTHHRCPLLTRVPLFASMRRLQHGCMPVPHPISPLRPPHARTHVGLLNGSKYHGRTTPLKGRGQPPASDREEVVKRGQHKVPGRSWQPRCAIDERIVCTWCMRRPCIFRTHEHPCPPHPPLCPS